MNQEPVTDIFIRTYSKDLPWLSYALQSIHKFCRGFRDIIIVIPESQKHLLDGFNLTKEKVFTCPDYKDDYLGQQITKINADTYSDAPYIFFTDSDTLLIRETKPSDFMRNGKPFMLKTHYSKVAEAIMWKPVTEQLLQFPVEFEFMRRLPFLYHASTLKSLRIYAELKHKKTITEYVEKISNRRFSEFNAIGAYADKFENDKYVFQNTDDGLPELHVRQFWSWGGLKPEVLQEINNILQ